MALAVQPRDLEILKFVFAARVATCEQIAARFFAKRHRSIAFRRLKKLSQQGWIKPSCSMKGNKVQRFFEVTPKAWPMIRDRWPFEVENPHFKSESPLHDVRLLDVVQRLSALSCFDEFLSENLLQSSNTLKDDPILRQLIELQADGALLIKNPKGETCVYSVELEISKKTPERYRSKLSAYKYTSQLDGILYVCASHEIQDSLARVDAEVSQNSASLVHFATEESVLKCQGPVRFKSYLGHRLELV